MLYSRRQSEDSAVVTRLTPCIQKIARVNLPLLETNQHSHTVAMRPLYHEMFINQGSVHHKMYQAKDKDFVESAQSSLLVVSVDLFLVTVTGTGQLPSCNSR